MLFARSMLARRSRADGPSAAAFKLLVVVVLLLLLLLLTPMLLLLLPVLMPMLLMPSLTSPLLLLGMRALMERLRPRSAADGSWPRLLSRLELPCLETERLGSALKYLLRGLIDLRVDRVDTHLLQLLATPAAPQPRHESAE